MPYQGEDRRRPVEDCPLSSMQAHHILETVRELKIEQGKIYKSIEDIKIKMAAIDVEEARKKGFNQGAIFWMRSGIAITLLSIAAGISVMWAVITGKISIGDMFKDF